MKVMKKDKTIERAFSEYFDGARTPSCDLTQAKRALAEVEKRREKRRGILIRVASSLACFLLVAAVAAGVIFGGVLPGAPSVDAPSDVAGVGEPAYYTLASARAESATYAQLSGEYGGVLGGLSRFETADNAQAEYTLYCREGEQVLLFAHLKYLHGLTFWEADVYFDLTNGQLLPEELQPLEWLRLQSETSGGAWSCSTQLLNGEYVSEAVLLLPEADCYMTVTGNRESAALFLRGLLAEEK